MKQCNIIPDYLIVDGHNMAYKHFHALHQFSSSDGKPIGVIMGMTRSMVAFQNSFPNTHMVVCFDNQGVKDKQKLCPEYKTNRVYRNHAFYAQLNVVKGLLPLMGINSVDMVGYEADQLVASYVKQLPGKKIIVSDDKDLSQCVCDDVHLLQRPGKKWIQVGAEDIVEKFGVTPKYIPDFLALSGDKVDCIPGIRGIGPSYARELITEYGSIDNIFNSDVAKQDPRFSSCLTEENFQIAKNYLKLTSLPGDVNVPHVAKPTPDPDGALYILDHYGLKLAGNSLRSLFSEHEFRPLSPERRKVVDRIIQKDIYMMDTQEVPVPKDAWRGLER